MACIKRMTKFAFFKRYAYDLGGDFLYKYSKITRRYWRGMMRRFLYFYGERAGVRAPARFAGMGSRVFSFRVYDVRLSGRFVWRKSLVVRPRRTRALQRYRGKFLQRYFGFVTWKRFRCFWRSFFDKPRGHFQERLGLEGTLVGIVWRLGFVRSLFEAYRWVSSGFCLVNGKVVQESFLRLYLGDIVTFVGGGVMRCWLKRRLHWQVLRRCDRRVVNVSAQSYMRAGKFLLKSLQMFWFDYCLWCIKNRTAVVPLAVFRRRVMYLECLRRRRRKLVGSVRIKWFLRYYRKVFRGRRFPRGTRALAVYLWRHRYRLFLGRLFVGVPRYVQANWRTLEFLVVGLPAFSLEKLGRRVGEFIRGHQGLRKVYPVGR